MPRFSYPGQTRDQMPPWEGTYGAGLRSTLRCGIGPTYDAIYVRLTAAGAGLTRAQIEADIARFVIRIGNEVKWDLTGAQLAYIMDRRIVGCVSPANNGILPLLFGRPEMQPVSALKRAGVSEMPFSNIDGPAFGTLGESTFSIEIDWAAAVTGDAIESWSVTREPSPLGQHITLLPHRGNLAGIGTDEITDIKLNPARNLVAMHIEDANVSEVEIRADNMTILRATAEALDTDEFIAGYNVNANYRTVNFVNRSRFGDALPLTMATLRIRPTFTVAPGDYGIILEQTEVAVTRNIAANTAM